MCVFYGHALAYNCRLLEGLDDMTTQQPGTCVAGKMFTVNPANSDDHRKIGARGSVCVLHVCKSGLSLAFQVSST